MGGGGRGLTKWEGDRERDGLGEREGEIKEMEE